MENKNKTLVIYHKNCWDGMGSAYSAWCKFGNQADYLPMNYSQPIPDFINYDEVYILDYSFKLPDMRYILSTYPDIKFINLDHHEASLILKELLSFNNFTYIYDKKESGATLTWMYFHPEFNKMIGERNIPLLLEYIRDRDLWKFEMPNSRAISAYMRRFKHTFSDISLLVANIVKDSPIFGRIVQKGNDLLEYNSTLIDEALDKVHFIELGDYKVPAVNSSSFFSEICEALHMKYNSPFAVCYFNRSDGKRQWSLRSKPEFNLLIDLKCDLKIGGHPNSCGAEEDLNNPIKLVPLKDWLDVEIN